MSFLSKLFPFEPRPEKEYAKELAQINALAESVAKLSQDEIREEIQNFKKTLADLSGEKLYKKLVSIRPRVFALVREAAKRSIGQFHYDVQVLGGIVLCNRKIAEMKTGEGKTLTATLPLILFSLAGKGSHLVTVNDYLSRWQASFPVGPICHYLGVSIASIQHDASFIYDPEYNPEQEELEKMEGEVQGLVLDVKHMRPISRKEAYAADITYGTNNEFGFDYLRDNMVQSRQQLVQRDLFFAIVDEVDSILIDEARTPLIISSPDSDPTDKYYQFAKMVGSLEAEKHFVVDEKRKTSSLTEEGMSRVEELLGVKNLYDNSKGITTLHHIEQALRARANYLKDRDYVLRDGEIIIVDEFTGRLMFGRRYSEGLHQAIEAKENVKIQQESKTLATITFQNLFRLYEHLAGMTGTAKTEEEEFFKIYQLQVSQIPTHRPMIRKDESDIIYKTESAKLQRIVEEVKERNKKGQPVLIGTVSIAKNEMLSEMLKKAGISFELLNAKNHEREAHIVAQAGRFGAVTLATNIAGRGVDILLGGNPVEPGEAEKVRQVGGLHIIGTERHESRRIDNQLRGRAGRQGDPGSSQFFVSMEDDLMRLFGGEKMKNMMDSLGLPDDQPLEAKLVSRSIESAQKKIEGLNFDSRKHVLEYDDVLNRQRTIIYKRRRKYLGKQLVASGVDASGSADEVGDGADNIGNEIVQILNDELADVVAMAFASANSSDKSPLDYVVEQASVVLNISEQEKQELSVAMENAADAEFAVLDSLQKMAEKQLRAKEAEMGEVYLGFQRFLFLQSIDQLWMEHLDSMDHLRTSVNLQGYGQKDPLVEYKRRGYEMFQRLLKDINSNFARTILRVTLTPQSENKELRIKNNELGVNAESSSPQSWVTNRSDNPPSSPRPLGEGRGEGHSNIGRNDPCPCGAINPATGQVYKYKKCGLINASYHKR